MESQFECCLKFTRAEEGGYVADPRDSGNWTSGHVGRGTLVGSNMGIGAPALAAWMGADAPVTAAQMQMLPISMFEAIARGRYWTPLECGVLPDGIDLMLFDFGWNRGIATSLNILVRLLDLQRPDKVFESVTIAQALQSVAPDTLLSNMPATAVRTLQLWLQVQQDGIAGPVTVRAFEQRPDLRVAAIILALSAAQIVSYQHLANFNVYGAGWLARSVRRRATSLSVARLASTPRTPLRSWRYGY